MSFSVLMSVYEKENPKFLEKSLESIFNQTLKPDEVIVMKDGILPENLNCVIEKFMRIHGEIVTYQFEKNVKLGRCLKKGVELCSHNIIARMDSDDIASINRFEMQYYFLMNNKNISVVGSQIQEFYEDELLGIKIMPITHDEIKKYSKRRNPINHMTVMFRKNDVLKAGNYEHLPLVEDYLLWSKMLMNGFIFNNLPHVLVKARTGKDMYSRRGGFQYFKTHLNLRKKQREMGLLSRFEFFIAVSISFGFAIIPNIARKVLYVKFLRKPKVV